MIADGIHDPDTSNGELYRSWDPYIWDNDAQGDPGTAFVMEPNQGMTPFALSEQNIQDLYTVVSGLDENGNVVDGFLMNYVKTHTTTYGGEDEHSIDMTFDPTWYTDDPN